MGSTLGVPFVIKKSRFHHDNTFHKSAVTKTKLDQLGYTMIPYLSYFPDVTPWDCFLFPYLKKLLSGQKYESNEQVIAATECTL